MELYNPKHPGFVLADCFMNQAEIDAAADKIGMSHNAFMKILRGQAPITTEIADLLYSVLQLHEPKIWLGMQAAYDSWQTSHKPSLEELAEIC